MGLIEAGAYPNLGDDLAVYRAQYGLPACTEANGCLRINDFKKGPALTLAPGASIREVIATEIAVSETALDLDMVSSACPTCRLQVIQVPAVDGIPFRPIEVDTGVRDFANGIKSAAELGATAISVSYGFPADDYSDNNPTLRRWTTRPGVAIVASSGDSGFNATDGAWPQKLPNVISAGGTSVYPTSDGFTQLAWNYAGSSCAADLPPAVGQPAAVSQLCDGHRAASDISAVADPFTGVASYSSYAPLSGEPYYWGVWGGTSVSAPLIAGMYARAGVPAATNGPNLLYAAPGSAFTDVTLGANATLGYCARAGFPAALCEARPGWDGPTGLGTPNGLTTFGG